MNSIQVCSNEGIYPFQGEILTKYRKYIDDFINLRKHRVNYSKICHKASLGIWVTKQNRHQFICVIIKQNSSHTPCPISLYVITRFVSWITEFFYTLIFTLTYDIQKTHIGFSQVKYTLLFTGSIGFFSICKNIAHPQKGCLWSPQIKPMDSVKHSCRLSGGSDRPCPRGGYCNLSFQL